MTKETSIKKNLIVKLSSLILLALIISYCASFLNTAKEIREVFDADMIKSAKLIFGVVKHESFVENSAILDSELQQKFLNRYEYKIHAQAWKKGKIIFNSGENLNLARPEYEGFSDVEIGGKKWRGFAFFDKKSQIEILVLEKNSIRRELIFEIIFSLLIPLLVSFIPLFLIIISIVRTELKPLNLLAQKIEEISSETIKKFKNPHAPQELKPFLKSFNSLLSRLSDSMESERRFTDYAAHELNTPLTAIKIQAQILATNKRKEKDAEYLQDLLAGIDRATHLVDQLLTLSRLEVDNKNFATEKFCLKNLLESLTKNQPNIEIFYEEKSENFNIEANKFYIEILLRNLLENAAKYGEKNKPIEISITKKHGEINLKISNFGEKISNEEIEKIFNNFYRTNNTQNASGCGLGLAICKKIVDLHSGKISFKSQDGKNLVTVVLN